MPHVGADLRVRPAVCGVRPVVNGALMVRCPPCRYPNKSANELFSGFVKPALHLPVRQAGSSKGRRRGFSIVWLKPPSQAAIFKYVTIRDLSIFQIGSLTSCQVTTVGGASVDS